MDRPRSRVLVHSRSVGAVPAIERWSVMQHMAAVGSERCPHCDDTVVPDAPLPFGAATCEACGWPVWFLTINGSLAFFRHSDASFVWKLFAAIPEHQRLPDELGLDPLDVVEVLSEFKAALAR